MKHFDLSTDAGAYVLGILWGTMSISNEGFLVRHRDMWYLDAVRSYLQLSQSVHVVEELTGEQFRLKIANRKNVNKLVSILEKYGWTPRKAETRYYPFGDIADRGFIRAWVELHSSADVRMAKHRNGNYYPQKRVRIYGNQHLLEDINLIISRGIGQRPRRLQKTTNAFTKGLYFQGRNVAPVVGWLYAGAEMWNPTAKAKLMFEE